MLVFLCIAILVLQFIVMPMRVGFNFYLNLFGNDGFIKVYLFGIRIFMAAVHFEHKPDMQNSLVLEHGKKQDKIHLNTNPKDKKSVAAMMRNPLMNNVRIEEVSAHFIAGKTNDAFFTVALMQTMRVLFYSAMAALKCRFDMRITESFTPVYNNDILQVDFIGIICISIADIIVSLIGNLIQKIPVKGKQEVAIR